MSIPTKIRIMGAFRMLDFSVPLTNVVLASLVGGDKGGTLKTNTNISIIIYFISVKLI